MRQTLYSVDGLMVRGVANDHPLESDHGWSTTLPTLRVRRSSRSELIFDRNSAERLVEMLSGYLV